MIRLKQVKDFNNLMTNIENYMYVMTTGNGSMLDKPRVKGWVVFSSPRLGDERDFARWYPNKLAALKGIKLEEGTA